MFDKQKKLAYKRMQEDLEVGYLDRDIYSLLLEVFKRERSFPKSSCSGRIVIMEADYPWKKKGARIIFKNHFKIEREDIEKAISDQGRLWLVVQGPILHVYSKDLEEAFKVLEIARNAGFKHSGVLVRNEIGYLEELRTGVKVTQLLYRGINVELMCEIANEVLNKGKERLRKLEESFRASKN